MNRVTYTCFCLAVLGASCASAQDTPRPRTATNRSIFLRASGGSYLGIGVAEIDAGRAKALKLNEVRGAEVKSVDPDSPAAKAGLKEGDVVLEYNGQRIEGTEQFVRLVRETPVDRQVQLVVWRNGATQTLTAAIGRRHPQAFSFSGDDGDMTIEIPEVPPVPPMPEVQIPSVPEIPPMPNMAREFADIYAGRTGLLGIECETLGSQLAAFFGVKEGVLVRSVIDDSAAAKAGMRAGDVIVKIDGEAATSVHELTTLVHAARAKHTFPVMVMRDKKEVTLTVTLESPSRGTWPVRTIGARA
ncbi:MAG TPA: PDZ domain-containing protein [Bryobacteraceae bacterium]|nr:PDZ domain-containing protein [Bryobacteraceae bacterium]